MSGINLPSVLASDEVAFPGDELVFLAEFADAPHVNDVMMDPSADAKGVLVASGVRLHRAVNTAHAIVAQYDPEADRTPLDFMVGLKGAVLASARPAEQGEYEWQVMALGELPEGGGVLPVTGVRIATPEESARLDVLFPRWRENCRRFDEEHRGNPEEPTAANRAAIEQIRQRLQPSPEAMAEIQSEQASGVGVDVGDQDEAAV